MAAAQHQRTLDQAESHAWRSPAGLAKLGAYERIILTAGTPASCAYHWRTERVTSTDSRMRGAAGLVARLDTLAQTTRDSSQQPTSQPANQPVSARAIKIIARSINGANERLLIAFRPLSLAYLVIIACAYVQHLPGMSRLINLPQDSSPVAANIHSLFPSPSLPWFVVAVSPLPHYRQVLVIIKSVASVNVGLELSLGNTLAGGGLEGVGDLARGRWRRILTKGKGRRGKK